MELRYAWFLEQVAGFFGRGRSGEEWRLLDTLTSPVRLPASVAQLLRGRCICLPIDSYVRQAENQSEQNFWNLIPPDFFHALIASVPLTLLENFLSHTSRVLRPGGMAGCLITPDGDEHASVLEAVYLSVSRHSMNARFLSWEEAPLGADPAWYDSGRKEIFLVLKKKPLAPDAGTLPIHGGDFIPQEQQPWAIPFKKKSNVVPPGIVGRIHYLAACNQAKSILEINIHSSKIFSQLELPVRVRVSSFGSASPLACGKDGELEIGMDADQFFKTIHGDTNNVVCRHLFALLPSFRFDILYINVGPRWKTVLDVFSKCLPLTHPKSIVMLNAVVPAHPYGALPESTLAAAYARAAGLKNRYRYGDAYKAVFYIHDFFPQFSFCTLPGASNQTVIWRSSGKREAFFPSLDAIDRLDYWGMLENASLLMPVEPEMLPRLMGKHLCPAQYANAADWKKLVIPLVTVGI